LYGRGFQQPGGLGIGPPATPPVVKQLLIANAAVFVASELLFPPLKIFGAASPYLVWQEGHLWQPFTYMWLHGGLAHILMNMFALWMFGSPLAMAWGARRFLRFYLICGVGAGFIIVTWPWLVYAFDSQAGRMLVIPTVGASGAVYGVLLAYSLTWPDRTIMLIFPPVAFRAIWLIPLLFFMTLLTGANNVSHVGHLGGVAVAWIYLRRQGDAGKLFSIERLKYRWRRYRMRQKLRAVRMEEQQEWQKRRRSRDRGEDDRTIH